MSVVAAKKWGPSLLNGGKFYIYQGQRQPVSVSWKDINRFLKELKNLEKMQWSFSLPHEREALFKKKLEILTRDLPPNWTMIIGDTICVIIIVAQAVIFVRYKL